MAEVLFSIIAAGSTESSPPAGLACLSTEGARIVAYVSNPDDPDGVLLDITHDDVLQQSVVAGRRVAVLLCTLIAYDFNNVTKRWDIGLTYDADALEDSERALTPCDICQAECFSCDVQAKLNVRYGSTVSQDWLDDYEAYLIENTELDDGGLSVLDPP
jgi:hypothetical protein